MIDENLIFVSLITIFTVFIIQKHPYFIGIIGFILVFYYFYKGRFANPKDFISFVKNKLIESFEPCKNSNIGYCEANATNSNISFLPDNIRGSQTNSTNYTNTSSSKASMIYLKPEDYHIDIRLGYNGETININTIISTVPILLDYKLYLEKLIKFVLSIKTDDTIQKDFLAKKLQNKMSNLFYNAYNTISIKEYQINTYNELLYAEREFDDTLNIFVFLGMNTTNTYELSKLQKEFKNLNIKLNTFVSEKVNNIIPNDYNITTSFLPKYNEPQGVSMFDEYVLT